MDFDGSAGKQSEANGGTNPADGDEARRVRRLESERYLDDFNAELSGTTTRLERFGVGPKSKAAIAEKSWRSRTGESFYIAAAAEAYERQIAFRVGGRDVSMSLGDLRDVAQERYDHYAAKLREAGPGDAKDRARMKAYEELMRLSDEVAKGAASPDEIAAHIDRNNLDQEIVEAARNDPKITITDSGPQAAETAQAGSYADRSAGNQKLAAVDALFNAP